MKIKVVNYAFKFHENAESKKLKLVINSKYKHKKQQFICKVNGNGSKTTTLIKR